MEYSLLKKFSCKNVRSLREILGIVKGREDNTELYYVVLEDLESKVNRGYSIRKYEKIISGEIANYLALIGISSFLDYIDYSDLDDDSIVQIVVNHNRLFNKANKIVNFNRSQLLTILVSDPSSNLYNKIKPDSKMISDFLTITGRFDIINFDDLLYEDLIRILRIDRRILNYIDKFEYRIPNIKSLSEELSDINTIDKYRILFSIFKYRFMKRYKLMRNG